jgi:hypothetical protein
MITKKQIIYDIRNLAKGGGVTDDDRLSYRQVGDWVDQYRALLIRQDLEKKRSLSPFLVQDLGCVDMIVVDTAECCEITSECDIMRTELKLPIPIELYAKDAITYIGSVNKKQGYEVSSVVASNWDSYNTYTSKVSKAYILNGYVYITNESFLDTISIRGIFANPTDAQRFHTCNGDPCYTDDAAYPVSAHMIPTIKQMILEKELQVFLSTKPDQVNNANGNAE